VLRRCSVYEFSDQQKKKLKNTLETASVDREAAFVRHWTYATASPGELVVNWCRIAPPTYGQPSVGF
jgi:hypothetical protein